MPPALRQALVSGAGGALGIALMVALAEASGMALAAVPFATSIVLVLAAPESPQAQPRNILGGHVLSALCGFVVLWTLGQGTLVAPVAVGLGIVAMSLTRSLHPPASISGVLIVMLAPSWTFLVSPVLSGALILIAFAVAFHRLTREEPWPASWT